MGFLIKGLLGLHGLTKCQLFLTNSFVKPLPKGIALSLLTICCVLEISFLISFFSIFDVKSLFLSEDISSFFFDLTYF